eukprot:162518-Chlamydomonas_euryale.AAC.3
MRKHQGPHSTEYPHASRYVWELHAATSNLDQRALQQNLRADAIPQHSGVAGDLFEAVAGLKCDRQNSGVY